MPRKVRVAAAHVAPVYMDPMASAERAAEWMAKGAAEGVQMMVFPEVFLPGFPYWINSYSPIEQVPLTLKYRRCSIEENGPEIARVREAAREHNMVVVIGASERDGGTCYNASFMIDADGALLGVHRKLKPTYAERCVWGDGQGSRLIVEKSAVGRVGTLCCWEHTMNLARQALAEQGMEIHAGLWPGLSTITGFETVANLQMDAMMRNHALTAQTFVVSAGSPVTQEMIDVLERELGPVKNLAVGGAWSAIIHPFCFDVVPAYDGALEKLLIGDIDLDDLLDIKMWVDGIGHYARPDVLGLRFER